MCETRSSAPNNPTGLPQVVEEAVGGAVQREYTYGLQRIANCISTALQSEGDALSAAVVGNTVPQKDLDAGKTLHECGGKAIMEILGPLLNEAASY